mmetsp:Transcript_18304/g.49980  ORF Transcript_18304/g.49980 Transcript_18304/m.49980 type:complete len:121 (-) Transcript_18304:2036-2398(-)
MAQSITIRLRNDPSSSRAMPVSTLPLSLSLSLTHTHTHTHPYIASISLIHKGHQKRLDTTAPKQSGKTTCCMPVNAFPFADSGCAILPLPFLLLCPEYCHVCLCVYLSLSRFCIMARPNS